MGNSSLLRLATNRRPVQSAKECKQKKFFRETEDSRDPSWVAVGEYLAKHIPH